MPLIADADGVRAKIKANVGTVESEVEAKTTAPVATVSGRLVAGTQFVPLRLSTFPTTSGFRQNGWVYVDDGVRGYKMSLEEIKNLNTKTIIADELSGVNFDKVTRGDFIYIK